MMRITDFRAVTACAPATLVLCLALATAQTAWATSSGAFGFEAEFTAKGLKTGIGPLAAVSGVAPPGYSKTTTITSYQKVIPIVPDKNPVPSLFTNITSMKSHAASASIGIDAASAEGDVVVKGLNAALMLNPPPPAAKKTPIEPEPYLNISVNSIQSGASIDVVYPQQAHANTSATFSGLVIFGSLVNDQTIKFSGNVPNDTVIFQSPTVTITLNTRMIAGLISCSPKCVFSPESVTGSAIDISLDKALIDSKIVSGDITIGQSQAGLMGLLARPAEFAVEK